MSRLISLIFVSIINRKLTLHIFKIQILASSSKHKGIKDPDHGVIYDAIRLYSDIKLAESLSHMARLLAFEVSKKSEVYIDAVGCDGLKDFTLKSINDKITAVIIDSERSFKNILAKVKETCFSPDREEHCPKYEKGGDYIAAHFQVCWMKNHDICFHLYC